MRVWEVNISRQDLLNVIDLGGQFDGCTTFPKDPNFADLLSWDQAGWSFTSYRVKRLLPMPKSRLTKIAERRAKVKSLSRRFFVEFMATSLCIHIDGI